MGGAPVTVRVRGVDVDPDTGDMLEAIFAVLDPEGIRLTGIPGYGSYRDNDASGGTDNGGGHADLYLIGFTDAQRRRAETVARSKGAEAFWRPARRPDGTRYGWAEHLHVLRMDAPDLSTGARTQVRDYLAGWNGLPIGGRTNRDTGSRAYLDRRWLTIRNQEDDMPLTAADAKLVADAVWARAVTRTEGKIPALQELADAKTFARIAAQQSVDVDALAAAVAAKLPVAGGATREDIAAALREVLGSLDEASA